MTNIIIKRSKQYSYEVTTPAAELPVSLAEMKAFLRITASGEDDLITAMIESATDFGELYTKRDFVSKTYLTYRDHFTYEIELRRSKLQSVESVKYLVDDVLTTVASTVYYNTSESDFSRIALVDGQSWPTDGDFRLQAIQISFIAGYGAASDVPDDIKTAIMNHVAQMYSNRGDCGDGACSANLPLQSKLIYNKRRIFDVRVGC